ncbi:MAG: PQQ-like beta-propeller repeat protein [Phycisphaerales bacterium]|jgi:outer membrane protein assembly factor BamB|nr:PQQ-like beta-propeller repeat protein [Phycisphaerales bacterium]
MPAPRLRTAALSALVAGGLLVLGGCASGGGSSGPGPVRERDRAVKSDFDHQAFADLGYRLDWEGFPIVSKRGRLTKLVAYPDMIVTQESGSSVSVLESGTGALRGGIELGSQLTKFLWLGRRELGGRYDLLVASETELFVVSGETLAILARQHFDEVIATAPARLGNLAIFGTLRGRLLAHDTNSGLRLWGNSMDSAIEAAPALVDDTVAAVSQTGQVLFVRANDGTLVSQARVLDGLANDPVASSDRVFIAGLDQSVYALDPRTGQQIWRFRTSEPVRSQPRYHDGALYIGLDDLGFTAIDPVRGTPRWSSAGVKGELVAVQNGDLIVFDGTTASRLDARTGDVIAKAKLTGISALVPDAFVDGSLYAIRNGNRVSKLVPR